jgi:hypothetical protein
VGVVVLACRHVFIFCLDGQPAGTFAISTYLYVTEVIPLTTALAIVGAMLGLFVTGTAIWTAWLVTRSSREQAAEAASKEAAWKPYAKWFLEWTVFDYAFAALFFIGALLLFVDLLQALRDAASYPPYHIPYLLCGFIFCFIGMLMALLRLALTMSLARGQELPAAPDKHHQPAHAEHTE